MTSAADAHTFNLFPRRSMRADEQINFKSLKINKRLIIAHLRLYFNVINDKVDLC